jgi:UDP-glucose 4-epimerase
MSVLVTGGAGYIGSHMTLALLEQGEEVVVLDNLSTGIRGLVPPGATFIEGTIADSLLLRSVIACHGVDTILHFAGSTVVPESVEKPLSYYENNTSASRALIEAAADGGIRHFIFSSTAAVYRIAESPTVAETAPTIPASPYGRSKLMTEWILEDAAKAGGFGYVVLRYFNVAGADPGGRTGQSTPRATHLIKRACQVALGKHPYLGIYGTDYPTPDGTGIRDYIHVSDLVAAHILALRHLRGGGDSGIFNCGYGRGFSVREIVAAVERAAGHVVPVKEMPRRKGDLAAVISDPCKLKNRLGWAPRHDEITAIVDSAFAWESRLDA